MTYFNAIRNTLVTHNINCIIFEILYENARAGGVLIVAQVVALKNYTDLSLFLSSFFLLLLL